MDTFTVRDLRERTGDLIRIALEGRLSLVTCHGKPVFVAVPFDDAVLKSGVYVVVAVKLFGEEHISLGKAARLADMSIAEFMEHLASLNIPVARPKQKELEQELDAFR